MPNPNGKGGFGSIPIETLRHYGSMGGKAVQASGNGHRWTAEEARAHGAAGGKKFAENMRLAREAKNNSTEKL